MHTPKAQNNVIRDSSPRNEGALHGVNYIVQNAFKSVNDGPSNDLVSNVAQANRPKVFHSRSIFSLRNEGYDCLIHITEFLLLIKNIKILFNHLSANSVPSLLKEESHVTIRAWSF